MTASIWDPSTPVLDADVFTVLANTSNLTEGDALIGVKQNLTDAIGTTQHDRNEYSYFANEYLGVDPLGVVDSAAGLEAFFAEVPAESTVIFPPGTIYRLESAVSIEKNLTIIAYGATFNYVGDYVSFLVEGVITRFEVRGGKIVGDGVNRDADSSKVQIGWSFGNEPGANVQNYIVKDVWVESTNQGFRCAAGTGTGSGPAYNGKFSNCHAKNIVGTVGGTGYGFMFSQASNSSFNQCTADNCQRHGFYFAEGRNYVADNCIVRNHRSTVSNSSYRAAFSISRSRNVSVTNCVFDNCYDGTVEVDVDTGGTPPDNESDGTIISNCTFLDSVLADIRVGTDPVIDGSPRNVLVSNCVMIRKAANEISSIVIESSDILKITNCLIDASASAGTVRAISINATGGDTYTQNLEIVNNTILSANVGIQIAAATQVGTGTVRILNNKIVATSAELEFVSGEAATTNNNLIYKRTSGLNAARDITTTGASVTVPVGGVDDLFLSPASALSILQFSGAVDGQRLTLQFTNGNTTILNTNVYLLGAAASFVGTSNDILTLRYRGGFWYEVSRSVN